MAKQFTITENGYDPIEVDKYVDMIQTEYHNAVQWGEENEAKYEKLRKDKDAQGYSEELERLSTALAVLRL